MPWPLLASALLWFVMSSSAHAEKYLAAKEARHLCFPTAERFEETNIRLTPDQVHAIEKKSGIKVLSSVLQYWTALQGTNVLGVFVPDRVLGKHEIIDYAVAVSPEGRVLQIEVLEYRESHGNQIRNERWRNQFKGKTTHSKLRLNEDIYNISGATLSCRAVTEGVKRSLAAFELLVRSRLSSGGGLPDGAKKSKP